MVYEQPRIPTGEWDAQVLWDFERQTDQLISAGRLDLGIVKKKENLPNSGLCRSGWPQGKIERKQKER